MKINIDRFIALRHELQNERIALEVRLNAIAKALGQSTPVPTTITTTVPTPGIRVVSEATRAKMRAAQQARHAKNAAGKVTATPASTPKKRRKMSAATKAKLSAAATKRWAKRNAGTSAAEKLVDKTTAPKKRRLSKEGRAAIIAATKAWWAKKRAEKAAKLKK